MLGPGSQVALTQTPIFPQAQAVLALPLCSQSRGSRTFFLGLLGVLESSHTLACDGLSKVLICILYLGAYVVINTTRSKANELK